MKPIVELLLDTDPADTEQLDAMFMRLAEHINGHLDASAFNPGVKLLTYATATLWPDAPPSTYYVPGAFREPYSRLLLEGHSSSDYEAADHGGVAVASIGSIAPVIAIANSGPVPTDHLYVRTLAVRMKRGLVKGAKGGETVTFRANNVVFGNVVMPVDRSQDVDGWVSGGYVFDPPLALPAGCIHAECFRNNGDTDGQDPAYFTASVELLVPHFTGSW